LDCTGPDNVFKISWSNAPQLGRVMDDDGSCGYNRGTKKKGKKRKKEEMGSLLLAALSKQLLDRAL